jgi:hypothetical protein
MRTILNASLFALGLAVGTAAVAQAQSISSLPPNAGEQGQTARTLPYGSTQGFYPKPGGSEIINEEPAQPPATASETPAAQPYSTGPRAN